MPTAPLPLPRRLRPCFARACSTVATVWRSPTWSAPLRPPLRQTPAVWRSIAGSKAGAAAVCPTCGAASSCRTGSSSPDSLANPGSYQR